MNEYLLDQMRYLTTPHQHLVFGMKIYLKEHMKKYVDFFYFPPLCT